MRASAWRKRRTGERAELVVATGLGRNRHTAYRLGPPSPVTSRQFNRAVLRLRTNRAVRRAFLAGDETTGKLEMPLLTLHTTGDGQVPIEQARILQRRVDAAGRHRLLVQRVLRDAGHCGFTSTEWEASLEALLRWVGGGRRPKGNDVLVQHLNDLRRRFELSPRPGTPEAEAVRGARRRVRLHGRLTLRRCTVRRPVSGSGGAEEGRTDHALPVGPAAGPPRALRDHGDGRRGGERVRRAGRADRALDLRGRQDPLQPRGTAMASAPAPGAWMPPSRARRPKAPLRPERNSPVRSSARTATSCRAARASRPTSARRAAA